MQIWTHATEKHNQVAGINYRKICLIYGFDSPKTKWEIPQKMIENGKAKIPRDFPIQADKQVLANQSDTVVIYKKSWLMIDIAIPINGKKWEVRKIPRSERENLENSNKKNGFSRFQEQNQRSLSKRSWSPTKDKKSFL